MRGRAAGDHVEAPVGEGQLLGLALEELDVARAHLRGRRPGLRQHLRRHVDPGHAPSGADHLRGDERVGAGAAAEVEHALARRKGSVLPGVRHAGERLDGGVGYGGQLGRIAQVLGPGPAGREDEVLLGLLRDRGVGLLDLALQQTDVDAQFNCHATSFRQAYDLSHDRPRPPER